MKLCQWSNLHNGAGHFSPTDKGRQKASNVVEIQVLETTQPRGLEPTNDDSVGSERM